MPTRLDCRCCVAGGGPAGIMLGLLLARAGVQVLVLEKHGDFLRDFRGDTVHPSTLQVLEELGLLDAFLQRPHDKVRELKGVIGGQEVVIADFSRLRHPFIAMMPQWEFLDFLRDEASRYPSFRLLMNAQVQTLVRDGTRVAGVRGILRNASGRPDGDSFEVHADLVVAADGRHSDVRSVAGMAVRDIGAPIDVLWMRLPRHPGDPSVTGGRIERGRFFVTIDRRDYWQCAYVISKGGIAALQARGLEAFRKDLVSVAPLFADRMDTALRSWDDVKLLSVTVDRLEQWWQSGLLAIGDAAHAMSPVGGVGINLAIQDAVASANLLAAALADVSVTPARITRLLASVQKRRSFPVRVTQAVQVAIQDRLLRPLLQGGAGSAGLANDADVPLELPWPLRLMRRWPVLRALPAYAVGIGARPEHVRSAQAGP